MEYLCQISGQHIWLKSKEIINGSLLGTARRTLQTVKNIGRYASDIILRKVHYFK
jgi:hypothetical protein